MKRTVEQALSEEFKKVERQLEAALVWAGTCNERLVKARTNIDLAQKGVNAAVERRNAVDKAAHILRGEAYSDAETPSEVAPEAVVGDAAEVVESQV